MADCPAPPANALPTHIGSLGIYGIGAAIHSILNIGPGGAAQTWTVANAANYSPVVIPWPYPVARVWWQLGTSIAGNSDFGIYTTGGAKIFSTGSTALSGSSQALQYVSVSTPFILSPGFYWFAYVHSATTASRVGGQSLTSTANAQLLGLMGQTSALPLPASATFATAQNSVMAWCGITRTASGF